MTDLHALAKMLDEAPGPSRELDAHIECVLGRTAQLGGHVRLSQTRGADGFVRYTSAAPSSTGRPICGTYKTSEHSGSIDATEALRQRLLPGCRINVREMDDGTWEADLWPSPHGNLIRGPNAPTECLARLKALVSALIAMKEKTDEA